MAGIFGVVSKRDCIGDDRKGTMYLQDRAPDYGGMAWRNGCDELEKRTRKGLFVQNFKEGSENLNGVVGNYAIGSVSGSREPVSESLGKRNMVLCFDGNIANHNYLKYMLLAKGASFTGYHNPKDVGDAALVSKMIIQEGSFVKGIERLLNEVKGDFSIVALTNEGVYGARGWGRKPLILGAKDGSYAISSESVSFINTGFRRYADVKPGEVVHLDESGFGTVKQFKVDEKFGTFEWVYTAHPCSVVDGRSVKLARNAIGVALARRYPVEADIVSPIPDSGRNHAEGYSLESGIFYNEVFTKFGYVGRSFTPGSEEEQHRVADEKLIPTEEVIRGKRIIVVDDSIVKGNQTRKHAVRLRELGAKEVHGRIACPPLKGKCDYGKAIKQDEQCIAVRMSVEEIRKRCGFDSLGYATQEDVADAIGKPVDKLCWSCWKL